MPGGDTSDFGQIPAPTCQSHQLRDVQVTSIAEAEAAGFDFTDARSVALGRHEFAVRWAPSVDPQPTRLNTELHTTGRVQVTTWFETTPDPRQASLPLCLPIPAWASLEVEVQIATADGAVSGAFTGWLWFSRSRADVAPPFREWVVYGDGSSLRGELQFPPDPPDPHHLEASIRVVRFEDGDDRPQLELSLLHATGNQYPLSPIEYLQGYAALPADGCASFAKPIEPTPPGCEQPWTVTPWFNNCCASRFQWMPDVGPSDDDAGTP